MVDSRTRDIRRPAPAERRRRERSHRRPREFAGEPEVYRRPEAPWQTSAALLLVLSAALGGLHVLFDEQSWWLLLVFVTAVVLAAAAGARALTGRAWVPPIAGGTALVGMVTLFFAADTAILGVIPTFGTLSRAGELFTQANDSIYRQAVPAAADSSIVFVLCVSIGVIALICDLLAITLRMPALAGVFVLGILAVPAFTLPDITDPVVFVITAAAFLLLLVVGTARRQSGLATAIGSVAIVATLVLPVFLPAVDASLSRGPAGPSSGVNPVLSLGDDLRRASARTVLDYSTGSGAPLYLRLVTLDEFDGDEWAPTPREVDTGNRLDDFGPVPGLDAGVQTAEEITNVDVRNLTTRWAPVPYPARSIDGLPDGWFWDAEGFSVSNEDDSPRGQEYVVQSLLLQPTPEQLLAAGTVVDDDLARYLDLPEDLPAVISDTAAQVASASPTNYERALALQEYFRSAAFEYSEDAPVDGDYDGTGMDIIARFLDAGSGYCVHFASAMAVMARSLDIPARVVVGFLPGTQEELSDGTVSYEVDTHDLHSWPELYFDGVGWVQFEPTPGRGSLGAYADTTVEGVPAPPQDAQQQPQPSGAPAPSASQAPDAGLDAGDGAPTVEETGSPLPWIALGAFGVILVSLIPAGIRVLQRHRLTAALRARDATALDAWAEVWRTAVDLDRPVARTETPRETAATLGIGTPALSRILSATEETGYASTTLTDPRALVDDVRAVQQALADATPARTRRWAAFYPASVWRRILHPLSPPD